MKHMNHLLSFAVLLFFNGVSPVFAERAAQNTVPAIQKQTRLISSKAPHLEVINSYGDVRLRFGGYASEMELLTLKQNLDGDLQVEVSIDRESDRIIVKPLNQEAPRKSRLDLVVMVPAGKTVAVETDSGLVEAKGLHDALRVKTQSGNVRLNKIKGRLMVQTVSGDIEATLTKKTTKAEQVFSSVTGHVSVWVAENESARVEMATSGDLITHFSLSVTRTPHAEPDKHAVAVLADGDNKIILKSRRGNVALRAISTSTTR